MDFSKEIIKNRNFHFLCKPVFRLKLDLLIPDPLCGLQTLQQCLQNKQELLWCHTSSPALLRLRMSAFTWSSFLLSPTYKILLYSVYRSAFSLFLGDFKSQRSKHIKTCKWLENYGFIWQYDRNIFLWSTFRFYTFIQNNIWSFTIFKSSYSFFTMERRICSFHPQQTVTVATWTNQDFFEVIRYFLSEQQKE